MKSLHDPKFLPDNLKERDNIHNIQVKKHAIHKQSCISWLQV